MDDGKIQFEMEERAVCALHSAVVFTLEKWCGQESIDQEVLMAIKPFLQSCIFEFDFMRE